MEFAMFLIITVLKKLHPEMAIFSPQFPRVGSLPNQISLLTLTSPKLLNSQAGPPLCSLVPLGMYPEQWVVWGLLFWVKSETISFLISFSSGCRVSHPALFSVPFHVSASCLSHCSLYPLVFQSSNFTSLALIPTDLAFPWTNSATVAKPWTFHASGVLVNG